MKYFAAPAINLLLSIANLYCYLTGGRAIHLVAFIVCFVCFVVTLILGFDSKKLDVKIAHTRADIAAEIARITEIFEGRRRG